MSAISKLMPGTEDEAAQLIGAAAADKTTLAIEGGGTKSAIGRPVFADSNISSAKLSAITAYNPEEMVISARAGTPLADINNELAEHHQMLAFEPPMLGHLFGSAGDPTIGAVVATNGSGPRRIVEGAARDSLLGVRFINGRGEVVKNGGRVMKNVTGLDLVKLMAGSWGTLGFLSEVTFKVLPLPKFEQTLVLRGLDDDTATTAMAHAMASPNEVSGAAHLPDLVAERMIGGAAATLFRLEGFADSVRIRMPQLQKMFVSIAQLEVLDGDESVNLWRGIRDVAPFGDSDLILWRVSMKPSEAHKFVMAIRMHAAIDAYYDWQGGLVWLSLQDDNPHDELIRSELAQHGGGHAMLVRADSQYRALVPVFQPLAKPVEALSQRVKAAFDPLGVFNPGLMAA